MIAICKIKIRPAPDAPATRARRIAGVIRFASDTLDALTRAVDDLIDHEGQNEVIFYEIRNGNRVIIRGHSL